MHRIPDTLVHAKIVLARRHAVQFKRPIRPHPPRGNASRTARRGAFARRRLRDRPRNIANRGVRLLQVHYLAPHCHHRRLTNSQRNSAGLLPSRHRNRRGLRRVNYPGEVSRHRHLAARRSIPAHGPRGVRTRPQRILARPQRRQPELAHIVRQALRYRHGRAQQRSAGYLDADLRDRVAFVVQDPAQNHRLWCQLDFAGRRLLPRRQLDHFLAVVLAEEPLAVGVHNVVAGFKAGELIAPVGSGGGGERLPRGVGPDAAKRHLRLPQRIAGDAVPHDTLDRPLFGLGRQRRAVEPNRRRLHARNLTHSRSRQRVLWHNGLDDAERLQNSRHSRRCTRRTGLYALAPHPAPVRKTVHLLAAPNTNAC